MRNQAFLARRIGLAAALGAASFGAAADDAVNPTRGPYAIAAVGQGKYVADPGFIFCTCRGSDRTTAVKLGGGYRFGVSAVEAWAFDFGRADFGADPLFDAGTSRIRGLAVAAAWTARFGPSFEATWRVGGAELNLAASGQPSTTALRPLFGMSAGFRVADMTWLEFSGDITRARDSFGVATEVNAWWLGVRQRF